MNNDKMDIGYKLKNKLYELYGDDDFSFDIMLASDEGDGWSILLTILNEKQYISRNDLMGFALALMNGWKPNI